MSYQRPDALRGTTSERKTPCTPLFITINKDGEEVVEVDLRTGKAGQCINTLIRVIGRLISVALQHGTPVADIVKQLEGNGCPRAGMRGVKMSCLGVIAQALEEEDSGSIN